MHNRIRVTIFFYTRNKRKQTQVKTEGTIRAIIRKSTRWSKDCKKIGMAWKIDWDWEDAHWSSQRILKWTLLKDIRRKDGERDESGKMRNVVEAPRRYSRWSLATRGERARVEHDYFVLHILSCTSVYVHFTNQLVICADHRIPYY